VGLTLQHRQEDTQEDRQENTGGHTGGQTGEHRRTDRRTQEDRQEEWQEDTQERRQENTGGQTGGHTEGQRSADRRVIYYSLLFYRCIIISCPPALRCRRRSDLHTVPVEPAGVAGRTLEDREAEDGIDGVQTDRAGLRQTEVQPPHRLGGTVVWTVGPRHRDGVDTLTSSWGQRSSLSCDETHGKCPSNWDRKPRLLPQGKWTILLQLRTLQPTHAPFFLQPPHACNTR